MRKPEITILEKKTAQINLLHYDYCYNSAGEILSFYYTFFYEGFYFISRIYKFNNTTIIDFFKFVEFENEEYDELNETNLNRFLAKSFVFKLNLHHFKVNYLIDYLIYEYDYTCMVNTTKSTFSTMKMFLDALTEHNVTWNPYTRRGIRMSLFLKEANKQ